MADQHAFFLAQAQVVRAVGGRRMHHAGALFETDEVGVDDHVRVGVLGQQVCIERLVALAHQVAPLHALHDLVVPVEDVEPGLGQDQELVALFDLDVVEVVADRERDVPGQRPGCGRPAEDRSVRILGQAEADVDAGVGDIVAIPLCQLV